jgi:carbon-monoxide dehydrogenase large subunit
VSIVHGDTDKVQMGMGTYGSRSARSADRDLQGARQGDRQGEEVRLALHGGRMRHRFKDGVFSGRGTDKTMPFGDVALQAYVAHKFDTAGIEPGLKEKRSTIRRTSPSRRRAHRGVEIDPETGVTDDRASGPRSTTSDMSSIR